MPPAGRIGISLSSLLKGDITTAELNLGSANIQVNDLKNNDLLDKIFSSLSRTTSAPENLIQSTTALILSNLSKINLENSTLTIIKRETAAPIIVKGLNGIFSKKEGWIATVEGLLHQILVIVFLSSRQSLIQKHLTFRPMHVCTTFQLK